MPMCPPLGAVFFTRPGIDHRLVPWCFSHIQARQSNFREEP
jgi:hypothetical protein